MGGIWKQTKRSYSKSIVTVVVIILCIIFFRILFIPFFTTIQKPLVIFSSWLNGRFITSEEYKEMRAQRDSLAARLVEDDKLKRDNDELRAILGFSNRSQRRIQTAAVIARSGSSARDVLLIDRGSDDGLTVGDPVVVGDGYFIGKISSVAAQTSTIKPLTDEQSATAGSILNTTRTIGIIKGDRSGLLKLELIPQDEQIDEFDLVVTSGLETSVPSGLLIGLIRRVETTSTDAFQSALIEPFVDLRRTTIVGVLISEGQL